MIKISKSALQRDEGTVLARPTYVYIDYYCKLVIVGFFIFVMSCILEWVFFHLEGMCSDHKRNGLT